MKLYAPKYYKNFRCIADKCTHSCCIGWEIDIDSDTLEKYKSLSGGYGDIIADSISTDETPHFKLCENDRCPHLDGNGLCRIILNIGEDHLCDICRLHPRFFNYTDVAEVGLGMSCEEAARLILSSPDYAEIEETGDVDVLADDVDFDGRAERSRVFDMLQERECSYQENLEKIYRQYSIESGEDSEWQKTLDTLEYLDESHRNLFLSYSSSCRPIGKDEYLERFFAYFVYRHCTEALNGEDFRERLAFCLFCERLFASLICAENADELCDIVSLARIISEEIEYSDDNTFALMC